MTRLGLIIATSIAAATATSVSARSGASSEPAISISELSGGRYELVYSGTTFTSRDKIEGELLLSSAQLALAHGQDRFLLLALPGEHPDVRAVSSNPTKYGHWQPHWNYYRPKDGWQWWHPEWGDDFWTRDVDPKTVERFEVHAMVDLGGSAGALDNAFPFNAREVVRELRRPSNLEPVRDAH